MPTNYIQVCFNEFLHCLVFARLATQSLSSTTKTTTTMICGSSPTARLGSSVISRGCCPMPQPPGKTVRGSATPLRAREISVTLSPPINRQLRTLSPSDWAQQKIVDYQPGIQFNHDGCTQVFTRLCVAFFHRYGRVSDGRNFIREGKDAIEFTLQPQHAEAGTLYFGSSGCSCQNFPCNSCLPLTGLANSCANKKLKITVEVCLFLFMWFCRPTGFSSCFFCFFLFLFFFLNTNLDDS